MLVPRPMGTSVDALGDDFRFRPSRLGRRTPCRMSVRWNPKAEPCSTGRLTLLAAVLPLNSYAVRPDAEPSSLAITASTSATNSGMKPAFLALRHQAPPRVVRSKPLRRGPAVNSNVRLGKTQRWVLSQI